MYLGSLSKLQDLARRLFKQNRTSIQQQIQARLQVKANELTAYEQWRRGLGQAQKQQLNTRVQGVQDALTGGIQRNLINPDPNVNQMNDQELSQ